MKIYLIAVEPSADQLGADLAKALRAIAPDVQLVGIGGDRMRAVGIPSQMSTDGLAILGITEALKKLPHVYRKIEEAAERIHAASPDAVIFLDSYGFMVRLAERLRKQRFEKTLIKYVAPQVWAMRPSRAKRVARLFDGLLTLHPFEPDYFTPLGLETRYVGNAVFDMDYKAGDPDAIGLQYALGDRPILSVFFGSRASEVARLAKPFVDAVMALKAQIPDLAIISPVSDSVVEEVGAAAGADPRLNEIIFLPEHSKLDAMACSRAALACSGTVTTQLACAGIPTVVAYRLSGISYALVSRMIKLDYISMVNIAADEALMPEFVQDDVTGVALSSALLPYLEDAKKRATASNALMSQTDKMRGPSDVTASAQAAQAILAMLS
jgi:lipid-A-disaccharide synthase